MLPLALAAFLLVTLVLLLGGLCLLLWEHLERLMSERGAVVASQHQPPVVLSDQGP
jgi:hypothetical protein